MPAPGSAQFNAQNDAFNNDFAELDGKGMFKAGDPVQPSKTSKTVRVRNGHTEAASGPFNHTGDQLVGFYVIEAKDLDEADQLVAGVVRSEEHTSELQSHLNLVCRLLLEKKKNTSDRCDWPR